MKLNDHQRILVLLSGPKTGPFLMQYASAIATARRGEVTSLHLAAPQAHLRENGVGMEFHKSALKAGVSDKNIAVTPDNVQAFVQNWPYALWVAKWLEDNEKLRDLTTMAQRMDVPILVIKKGHSQRKRRILVATSGGIHALETIKIAANLSAGLGAEAEIVQILPRHIAQASEEETRIQCHQIAETMKLELRLAGLDHLPFRVCVGDSIASALSSQAKAYDTLIIGGPSEWRLGDDISGSIPDELAKTVSCTLMMVVTPQHRELSLQHLFWHGTICTNMPRLHFSEAITALVDKLIASKQLPGQLRDRTIEAAFSREQLEPTIVEGNVAIPHAALGNFTGTLAALGISRGGVAFGEHGDKRAHLVFLFITSSETYDSYLPALSQVARLVLSRQRRAKLISSGTAVQAAAVIQDFQKKVLVPLEIPEASLESVETI